MKIYSDDGKGFDSVEACESYEETQRKAKEAEERAVAQKVEDRNNFIHKYISEHIGAKIVTKPNGAETVCVSLHDDASKAGLHTEAIIGHNFGPRVCIRCGELCENYTVRLVREKSMRAIVDSVYEALVENLDRSIRDTTLKSVDESTFEFEDEDKVYIVSIIFADELMDYLNEYYGEEDEELTEEGNCDDDTLTDGKKKKVRKSGGTDVDDGIASMLFSMLVDLIVR